MDLPRLVAELRGTLGKMEAALDSISEGIVWTDEHCKIQWCNERFIQLLGRPKILVLGKDITELFPLAEAHVPLPYEAHPACALKMGKPVRRAIFEFMSPKREEVSLDIESTIVQLPNGNDSVVLVVRDLTHVEDLSQFEIYKTAIAAAANAVAITNGEGDVLWVNPAFNALTGYSLEEIYGKNLTILKSGKTPDKLYKGMHQSIRAGKIWQGELINKRKDGTLYYEEQTITPVVTKRNEITYFIAIKQNITHRKKTEQALLESEKRIRTILDSAPDAILNCSEDGSLMGANPMCFTMFDYEDHELFIKSLPDLIPDLSLRKLTPNLESEGIVARGLESVGHKKDGKEFPVEMSISLAQLNNSPFFTIVIHDITERKETERELAEQQERLEADLEAAGKVQLSLIPKTPPSTKFFRMHWKFVPSGHIGGDIFNVVQLDEEHYAFYVVDVSGHGVPSSLIAVSVSQVLEPQYLSRRRPAPQRGWEILPPTIVLDFLDRQFPMERFNNYFTMLYAVLNVRTGKLQYSCAGHPPPFHLQTDGTILPLKKGGPLIGLGGALPFEQETIQLSTGDRIIMYTDGITEYENEQGQMYGEERFISTLQKEMTQPLEDMMELVYQDMMASGDSRPPNDDVTFVGIEYTGTPELEENESA